MSDLSRLYDFSDQSGSPIQSQQVDEEFDQLVARINDLPADALSAALAEQIGVSQTGTVHSGASIIATEESRSSSSYGTLTTPDQVSAVELPASGLLLIAFKAMWKCSVDDAGRAAIFLGGNQLKVASPKDPAPLTQAAAHTAGANVYRPVVSSGGGLIGLNSGGIAYTGDVTTGQVVGFASVGTQDLTVELDGTLYLQNTVDPAGGGLLLVTAAAGSYDVSVKFKATSGSVTAKERKLWVEARAF